MKIPNPTQLPSGKWYIQVMVDGAAVCKQYHKEGGVVYLFPLNRKRADADVVLLPSGGRALVCQGRVITKRRYPLPER